MTIVLLWLVSLAATFVSLDGLRRFLADVRRVRSTDLGRYRNLARRHRILRLGSVVPLAAANLLFVYGMITDRLTVGHLVMMLLLDGAIIMIGKPTGGLAAEARSLAAEDDAAAEYARISQSWSGRVPDS